MENHDADRSQADAGFERLREMGVNYGLRLAAERRAARADVDRDRARKWALLWKGKAKEMTWLAGWECRRADSSASRCDALQAEVEQLRKEIERLQRLSTQSPEHES